MRYCFTSRVDPQNLARYRERASRFVTVKATAPWRAAGKMGELLLTGGASSGSGSEDEAVFYDSEEEMMADMFGGDLTTIPELIKSFKTAQKNDEIRSSVQFRGVRTTKATLDTNLVVAGFAYLPVVAVR